jgi:PIN domain nuclease of toxin-antitoxin system
VRLLLDAHTLIWAVDNPAKLGSAATRILQEPTNELLLSAGTIWEISIKAGLGKLSLSLPFRQWIEQAIHDLGANVLPITVKYADAQSRLPAYHGDPFDRLLVAQAQIENVPLISTDAVFDQYNINRVW